MKMLLIMLAMLILLLAAHLLLMLWKERDSLRSAYWRWRGKPARERIAAQTEADRRAALVAAKEQENFMDYDGTEQPEIDVSELIGL